MKITQLDLMVLLDAIRGSIRMPSSLEYYFSFHRKDREVVSQKLTKLLESMTHEIGEAK